MQQHSGNLADNLEQRIFLQHNDDAEIHTPDDEIPGSSVPHTREEPHHKDVDSLVLSVAAHGNVDIVAEETSQRDMPATPEVGDAITAVGMTEVLIEMET